MSWSSVKVKACQFQLSMRCAAGCGGWMLLLPTDHIVPMNEPDALSSVSAPLLPNEKVWVCDQAASKLVENTSAVSKPVPVPATLTVGVSTPDTTSKEPVLPVTEQKSVSGVTQGKATPEMP